MNGAIERRKRAERIADHKAPEVRQPSGVQQSTQIQQTPQLWVVVRVAGLQHILVQRLVYVSLVEGRIKAVGSFFEAYPPPGGVYAAAAWVKYPLADADDVVYDHNPEPYSEDEPPEVTAYRTAFNAALDAEELAIAVYPCKVTMYDRAWIMETPFFVYENVGFMDDEEETEIISEGMGI